MTMIGTTRPIVLATASSARRKLVFDLGLKFFTDVVDIDETPKPHEDVKEYVKRLSLEKANKVIPPSLDAIIVTVDTAICSDGMIIGKPRDELHAREILNLLSDRSHNVMSCIAIRDVSNASIETEITDTIVKFQKLSPEMIGWYISTNEWKGRAGAYAIQDKGACLVEEVHGCFTNVIGISIPTFLKMLRKV